MDSGSPNFFGNNIKLLLTLTTIGSYEVKNKGGGVLPSSHNPLPLRRVASSRLAIIKSCTSVDGHKHHIRPAVTTTVLSVSSHFNAFTIQHCPAISTDSSDTAPHTPPRISSNTHHNLPLQPTTMTSDSLYRRPTAHSQKPPEPTNSAH